MAWIHHSLKVVRQLHNPQRSATEQRLSFDSFSHDQSTIIFRRFHPTAQESPTRC